MNKSNKAVFTLPDVKRPALICALVGSLALAACAPRVDNRGNQVHPEDVAAIEVGQSTRNQVLELLGSPSSEGNFGAATWYYISERTETLAFLAPELKERTVIAIEFDANDVVTKVETTDESHAEVVQPASGETPTAGNSLNFFQQIIGNLGRFNKDKKK